VTIKLFKVDSAICPFAALSRVWSSAPNQRSDAPLFQDAEGQAVSYRSMLSFLKDILRNLDINPAQVGLHSFRIGGATSLAIMGVPAHLIKTMGRWTSLCYQRYTRTTVKLLASTFVSMAQAAKEPSYPFFGGLDPAQAAHLDKDSVFAVNFVANGHLFDASLGQ
jgi:hypothetical protein